MAATSSSIRMVSDEREARFEADLRGTQAALLRAVGVTRHGVPACSKRPKVSNS
jgi:hypothetical protein